MKIFKRIKWSYVVLSVMFLLLGIFLVANPETSLIMICRILGRDETLRRIDVGIAKLEG